jgi:hypothetical protein
MIHHTTLEVNIVRHCNLRCACCSHAAPFARHEHMTPGVLARDLAALKPFLHVDKVVVLGGEALLHTGLCDMLDVVRGSGVGDELVVTTNGTLLHRMPEAFWMKIERLRVSIYPLLDRKMVELAQEKSKRYGFALDANEFNEFYKLFKAAPDDGAESFNAYPWRRECWTVHEGCFFLCPCSAFFPPSVMGLPFGTDGLPLDGLTKTGLERFIGSRHPLKTCRICHCFSERVPWHEAGSREEWMKGATI